MWVIGSGLWSRSEVSGVNEKLMRLRIEGHVAGAKFRFDGFHHAELVGSVLMEHMQNSFADGDQQRASFKVENIRVNPGADGEGLDDFSLFHIHDHLHFLAATDE